MKRSDWGDKMEFIVGYVMIATLLLFMGFSLTQIGVMTLILLGVFVALIGVFFSVCLAFLAMSRRVTAVFGFIDEEPRFPVAVYRVGDDEVPNLFPCEMIMRNKLYVPDKELKLLYCKPRKSVIDANALTTIIAGSAIFIPAGVFCIFMIVRFFGNLNGM